MVKYIGKKVLWTIVRVIAITTIFIAIMYFAKFDPASILIGFD